MERNALFKDSPIIYTGPDNGFIQSFFNETITPAFIARFNNNMDC